MTALWHSFGDLALIVAAGFWVYVLWQIASWATRAPRQFATVLCGELALTFAILAVLWAAHLADKYQLP